VPMAQAVMVLGGRYELDEQIGHGGYGEVWRATDTVLSRLVAVKLLYPGYAARPGALARFHAEARHAGSLSHHNIARVYDYDEPADGQSPYLVMELVDGRSLSDVLDGGPLDAARTMDVIAQAAAGLEAAHAAGLVHRDVKPANLLLDPQGVVKITDFGIAHSIGSARVTATGELIGTPGYLAPERVAGGQPTPAGDLYALGIVAYECLAGAPPFQGTALEVALAHGIRPLPPLSPSVPSDVGEFVMHLTARDPAWRPPSAADVALTASRLRDSLRAGTSTRAEYTPAAGTRPPSTAEQEQLSGSGRARYRLTLALAIVVLTGITGLVLARTNGSSPGSPVGVSSSTSSGSSQHSSRLSSPVISVATRPAGNSGRAPAVSARQPATALAASQTSPRPSAARVTLPRVPPTSPQSISPPNTGPPAAPRQPVPGLPAPGAPHQISAPAH
jgi:serine/threonine protein kinase